MADKTIELPDGSVVPLEQARFHMKYSTEVALDGEIQDLGLAYRMLLTYRSWAANEIERLHTEIADLKAGEPTVPPTEGA